MNKGFTLIELLAVIVILAIIALIATPIIINIINEAREASRARTAELVVNQVETAYSSAYMLSGNAPTLEQVAAKFNMDGASMAEDGTITVTMKGVDCTTDTPTANNVTSLTVSCTGGGKTKTTPAGLQLDTNVESANTVTPTSIFFTDNFESYEENTTVSSTTIPFSVTYGGTGDGNQKVITSTQKDGTTGKVLQLQGQSNWSAQVRHTFTPDDERYLVFEVDVKPVSGSTPGGLSIGSSGAAGTWNKSVCATSFGGGGFSYGKDDTGGPIDTDVTYTSGNWYHVKLILDRTDDVFYVVVDGTLLNQTGFSASTATPEWIELSAGNTGTNTTYYDNINLYSTSTSGI